MHEFRKNMFYGREEPGKMKTVEFLKYIEEKIHSVVVATVDEQGLPVTCAIDIMDSDENGLYFLTAKGKSFYSRLKKDAYIALTGMKGNETLSCVAVSVRGKVRELGRERLYRLFEKNPYMNEIYPSEKSRQALRIFQLYEGNGEWFDLSKKPIERKTFAFGGNIQTENGYFINEKCNGCGSCMTVCPQNCIHKGKPFLIQQEHCLHCGNCKDICPQNAVVIME